MYVSATNYSNQIRDYRLHLVFITKNTTKLLTFSTKKENGNENCY